MAYRAAGLGFLEQVSGFHFVFFDFDRLAHPKEQQQAAFGEGRQSAIFDGVNGPDGRWRHIFRRFSFPTDLDAAGRTVYPPKALSSDSRVEAGQPPFRADAKAPVIILMASISRPTFFLSPAISWLLLSGPFQEKLIALPSTKLSPIPFGESTLRMQTWFPTNGKIASGACNLPVFPPQCCIMRPSHPQKKTVTPILSTGASRRGRWLPPLVAIVSAVGAFLCSQTTVVAQDKPAWTILLESDRYGEYTMTRITSHGGAEVLRYKNGSVLEHRRIRSGQGGVVFSGLISQIGQEVGRLEGNRWEPESKGTGMDGGAPPVGLGPGPELDGALVRFLPKGAKVAGIGAFPALKDLAVFAERVVSKDGENVPTAPCVFVRGPIRAHGTPKTTFDSGAISSLERAGGLLDDRSAAKYAAGLRGTAGVRFFEADGFRFCLVQLETAPAPQSTPR